VLRHVYRPAGTLALGTGLGQGLVLLATPFLARVYGPAEFGLLALLVTVGNVSLAAGSLRFDLALPSAPEEDVRGLLVTSLLAAGALGLLAAAAAAAVGRAAWAGAWAGLLDRPAVVGACVALAGAYQASSAWLLRRAAYPGVAGMRTLQGATFGALAFVRSLGLLWAHALSFLAGALASIWILRRARGSDTPWWEAARRHLEFPAMSLPGALLDAVGYSVSIWVVSSTYGIAPAGEYSQIQRIIGAPMMLLSISLGQVLLKHTADLADDRAAMHATLVRLLRSLLLLAAAALAVLALAGAPLLSLLLGKGWRIEREMVVLLGLSVFVRSCVSPLSAALVTLRRFRLSLSWQGSYFASAALLMPWVAHRTSLRGYVAFYAAHELVFYGAYLFLILRAVRPPACAASSAS
jgi:O-antigen/teichoic acid export membrane protein